MRFFVKAIATGFAMSMGSAIFKKMSKKMGLEGEEAEAGAAPAANTDMGGEDPGDHTPDSPAQE